jgi:hypothetical protein
MRSTKFSMLVSGVNEFREEDDETPSKFTVTGKISEETPKYINLNK